MSDQNNSIDRAERRNIPIENIIAIEKAATEDSYINGILYTVPEYTREIVKQFLHIREHCRLQGLPLYRPVDVADAIISGDIAMPEKYDTKATATP